VSAAYRNDQRQEFVNNLAYKHGTGLGTAPWYGVPGTAYDFGSSKSAGATYHTDASHPTGYGYQGSVSQYHSQPAYGYAKTATATANDQHAGTATAAGPPGHHCSCGNSERLDIAPTPHDVNYGPSPRLDKAGLPIPSPGYGPSVIGGAVDHAGAATGYGGLAIDGKAAAASYGAHGHTSAGSKVGYDDRGTVPAGYVSGRYESVGYGYSY